MVAAMRLTHYACSPYRTIFAVDDPYGRDRHSGEPCLQFWAKAESYMSIDVYEYNMPSEGTLRRDTLEHE